MIVALVRRLPVLMLCVGLVATPLSDVGAASAGGAQFPDSVELGGEKLPIVGVGLRSKWMVKVYGKDPADSDLKTSVLR
ncbi:MAG: hypothetical protein RIT45_2309 [Pseudomonadota bacterium]|jgi:hypothetical protein